LVQIVLDIGVIFVHAFDLLEGLVVLGLDVGVDLRNPLLVLFQLDGLLLDELAQLVAVLFVFVSVKSSLRQLFDLNLVAVSVQIALLDFLEPA
jgi:hypothetical protein